MESSSHTIESMRQKLLEGFEDKQASILADVVYHAYHNLVSVGDFNELKAIMGELAEAQQRTEIKVSELAEAQKRTETRMDQLSVKMAELAEAQKRTETRMDQLSVKMAELAEAQKRTETRVDQLSVKMAELAEAQKRTETRVDQLSVKMSELAEAQKQTEIAMRDLTMSLKETRGELGGLSHSVGYALENEAYRMMPKVLKEKYGIEIKERFIRTEIQNKEINVFGRATKNGDELLIIGEAKMRLDDRRYKDRVSIFDELDDKVKAVKSEYGDKEIVRIIVTHFATKAILQEAEKRGVIIIQSFDW